MKLEIPLEAFPVLGMDQMMKFFFDETRKGSAGNPIYSITEYLMIKNIVANNHPHQTCIAIIQAMTTFLNSTFDELKVQDVFDGEWIVEAGYGDNHRAIRLDENVEKHRFMIKNKTISQAIQYLQNNYDYPLPEWKKDQKLIVELNVNPNLTSN